jgi:hypothetical protein
MHTHNRKHKSWFKNPHAQKWAKEHLHTLANELGYPTLQKLESIKTHLKIMQHYQVN